MPVLLWMLVRPVVRFCSRVRVAVVRDGLEVCLSAVRRLRRQVVFLPPAVRPLRRQIGHALRLVSRQSLLFPCLGVWARNIWIRVLEARP